MKLDVTSSTSNGMVAEKSATCNLHGFGHELEDIVDLVLETSTKHLASFVGHEHVARVGSQGTAIDHDTAGSVDHDLLPVLQGAKISSRTAVPPTQQFVLTFMKPLRAVMHL